MTLTAASLNRRAHTGGVTDDDIDPAAKPTRRTFTRDLGLNRLDANSGRGPGWSVRLGVSQPLRTVTFMFTDVEGSRPLREPHPTEMGVALARHDGILRVQPRRSESFDGDEAFDSVQRRVPAQSTVQHPNPCLTKRRASGVALSPLDCPIDVLPSALRRTVCSCRSWAPGAGRAHAHRYRSAASRWCRQRSRCGGR